MTDRVASVFAAMAAGGGTAVTIGPPSTTAEATALAACVVAMAVAEVDAVTGLTADGIVQVVAVAAAVDAVNVIGVAVVVDGEESNAVADDDVVAAAVVVAATVAAPTVFTEPLSDGWRATSFGGASVFEDADAAAAAVAVDCFLGKRGDNLAGGRLTVGLFPATALATGCARLGVLGDLVGSGDFGGTAAASLRGVGGNFLRGDDLTAAAVFAGTVGGLPAAAAGVFRPPAAPPPVGCLPDVPDVRLPAADRSLVDADSCLPPAVVAVAAGGRRPSARAIRGSDDCRLSGLDDEDDGLDARDRPFSGVLKP